MKKTIGICCALFLACSTAAVLTACRDEGLTEINFATYETWNDGFSSINMMDGFGRITRSDEQAHGGKYSAKLQPLGSYTDDSRPYFYYALTKEGDEGYNYSDFSKMASVSFYMYNGESETVNFDLCIVASIADVYGADCKVVGTYQLEAGKWTKITYKPDYSKLQDMCDITNVAGIGFIFENKDSADIADAPVLYLDDLKLSVSDKALAEIKTSIPARGEIQSFDLASSLVYVRMESGLDFPETYLAAGSDKLPEGVKGGVEFSINDMEMGSWPRFHFDSRTDYSELQGADRFSLMLYFETPDETVKQAELHMFPDTSSEYTIYVETNKWVKVTIESSLVIDNFGDSIGVQSGGLFWLQNGSTSCFNAIDAIRVADIKGEFDEVRLPELSDGAIGEAYEIPAATLEVDGKQVTAQSWSYSVVYSDEQLYKDKYGAIEVTDGSFTPQAGGVFVVTYTATYQGKTYSASGEVRIARAAAAAGEIESFDDPASLEGIRMNSGTGTEYIPEYLWAGDERLPADAKGGVEYTIDPIVGAVNGSWPRFYVNSRIAGNEIAVYDTVSFDIYLDAPGYDKSILLKMYPETQEFDKYVATNQWVTVRIDAAQFADFISRVSTTGKGFFWVQNGDPANVIQHIRIANISAYDMEDVRVPVGKTEIENFGDEYSIDGITVSDSSSVTWDKTEKSAVATVDANADRWLHVSVTARQDLAAYQALKEEGYNAVTLEMYLKAADGNTARVAQMNYWAQQSELNASQAAVAIGKWVTLTLDLDTYLTALNASGNGMVKLFWVASTGDAKLSEIHIRNVQVAKVSDAVSFESGTDGYFLLDSPENPAECAFYASDSDEIPAGRPQAAENNGAVKMSLNAGKESWPHLKFGADRNMFAEGNTVTITLYIKSSSDAALNIKQWPHGADWVINGEIPVNQWVEFKVDAEVLRKVFNWAPSNGIEYTDLFWFTNAGGNLVSEIWVAGMRVTQEESVAFAEAGINLPETVGTYEAGETDENADIVLTSTKGFAYKYTISFGDKVLVKDTDYTVNNDGIITLINPEAGSYTFTFTSYGNRFVTGTASIEVTAKTYTVSVGAAASGTIGKEYTLPAAMLDGLEEEKQASVTWSYKVLYEGEESGLTVTEGKFTPDKEGTYTVIYTGTYRGKSYEGSVEIKAGSYKVEAPVLENGKSGTEYALPEGTLLDGADATVPEGVTWTYTVSYSDAALYDGLYGEIAVAGGKFTPMIAGTYMVTYAAEYNGKSYTANATLTVERAAAATGEIESFDDAAALSGLTIGDVTKTSWDKTEQSAVGTVDVGKDSWLHVSVTARQDLAAYQALKEEGYNAVTLEMYLKAADGNTARVAQMNYWAQQSELNASQAAVAIGKWVTLTLDLDTYLTALNASGNGMVKLFWVASTGDAKLSEIHIRNVQVAKVSDAVSFESGTDGYFLLDSPENPAECAFYASDSDEIPAGRPQAAENNGAVKMSLNAGKESWPHLKFGADRNMFAEGNTVTITLYIKSSSDAALNIKQWPHGADWVINGEIPVNQWVEFKVDAEVLRKVFNWAPSNGIEYTDLFWFTNAGGNLVSEIWVAGMRVTQEESVAFAEAGINLPETVGTYEAGETDENADIVLTSTKGFAYKYTISFGDKVLVKDTDYTVNNDGIITLINPEAGSYTFTFTSYGNRFVTGTASIEVTKKSYEVIITGDTHDGKATVNIPYVLPEATLEGATLQDSVSWTYTVLLNGEAVSVEEGAFLPEQEGEYTVTYSAAYRGKTYTAQFTVNASDYSVEAPALENGVSGTEYTLPDAELLNGSGATPSDPENVTWTVSVSYSDAALYEKLYGKITVTGGKFTPKAAGEYTVVYQAVYNGLTYSGSATLTVARKAPAADEVESFDDLSSLQNVRLESGQPDYQKTYLREEGDLPEGAAGGVSFTVTDGGESGNWPNLYFNAVSMTPETLRTYGSVVIPMYIGVEADSRISEIQIEVNGVRVFVPVNTWYDVVLDAAYFADNLSARILWIQNGGDGVVNAVNEVRIASVYAKTSEGTPALLDMNEFAAFTVNIEGANVWADSGMSNAAHYQRSLAPEGMPDGNEIAVRLNADTADGDQWANVYARTLTKADVQSYMAQGYVSMTFWLYVEKSDTSSRQELQIRLLPNVYSESNIAVGQWVKCEVALGALAAQMDDSTGQVKLFWATVPASGNQPIEAIWMTGFTFENPGRIDIVDFSSDAKAKFDTATSGDKPNVTASWVEQSALPEGGEKPENGAVKLTTQDGLTANIRVLSQIDKQLYRSGYKAKILVYFASESSTEIAYSMIHWGSVSADQKISANTWVEIEVPAYQDGEQNDLYDVDAWFAGGFTGWLAVASDQNVSDIYVAGVWLESSAI